METFSPFELTNENLYVPLRGSTRRRTHQNRTVSRVLISVPLVHSVSHWCTRLQLHASAYALAGLWLGVGKAAGPGREFGVFQSYKDSKVRGNVGRVRHVTGSAARDRESNHVRAERETADRRAGVRELSSGPEDEKISRVPVGPGPPTPHHNRTRSRFFQSRHRDRPSRRRGDSNVLL